MFWFLHVSIVPIFLVTVAYHHSEVWWWCGIALGLWVGERLWRATRWAWSNSDFIGRISPSANPGPAATHSLDNKGESWEMARAQKSGSGRDHSRTQSHPSNSSHPDQDEESQPFISPQRRSQIKPFHIKGTSFSAPVGTPFTSKYYIPPPGYAHAELLSGRTIRLRFIPRGFLTWAPGQHFLISIPSLSRFTSHPFTIASVCDVRGDEADRALVFLIRAKDGWTKDLWDSVVELMSHGYKSAHGEHIVDSARLPKNGVIMRAYIDGPFGSSIRTRWETHSTVLILAGGSGVSFGLSVLQYVCMCMSGRDGKDLGGRSGGWGAKGFYTNRVRFVWLVKEFCMVSLLAFEKLLMMIGRSYSMVCICHSPMHGYYSCPWSAGRHFRHKLQASTSYNLHPTAG